MIIIVIIIVIIVSFVVVVVVVQLIRRHNVNLILTNQWPTSVYILNWIIIGIHWHNYAVSPISDNFSLFSTTDYNNQLFNEEREAALITRASRARSSINTTRKGEKLLFMLFYRCQPKPQKFLCRLWTIIEINRI